MVALGFSKVSKETFGVYVGWRWGGEDEMGRVGGEFEPALESSMETRWGCGSMFVPAREGPSSSWGRGMWLIEGEESGESCAVGVGGQDRLRTPRNGAGCPGLAGADLTWNPIAHSPSLPISCSRSQSESQFTRKYPVILRIIINYHLVNESQVTPRSQNKAVYPRLHNRMSNPALSTHPYAVPTTRRRPCSVSC